jgi:hypothetical protein
MSHMSLTDEDKHWISAQLERVTARDTTELQRAEERMAVRVERVETALLTEFHKWASPLEMRMRSHSAAIRTLDLELEGSRSG